MGARVTVRANFAPLKDLQLSTVALMREAGLLAREQILRRTAEGLDEDGQPFQPYSAAYGAWKAAYLGSSRVNLQGVSGAMLNAIQIVAVTDKSVTLGFI